MVHVHQQYFFPIVSSPQSHSQERRLRHLERADEAIDHVLIRPYGMFVRVYHILFTVF